MEDTKTCIKNVLALDYKNFELIVVDNGSTDGSKEYLSSLNNIIYVDLPENTGFTGGQNEALTHAKGEFLALVNSDAVLAKNWLDALLPVMAGDHKIGAVGGRAYVWNSEYKKFNTSNPFYSYQVIDSKRGYARTLQTGTEILSVSSISGVAVLIRKSVIEEIGYFDDRFFAYFEETDLFARMKRRGFKILYVPEAHAWHKIAQSSKSKPWFYLYQMHRNRALFALKNFDKREALRFWILYSFDGVRATAKYLRNKDLDAKARMRAWVWNCVHVLKALRDRSSVQELGKTYSQLLTKVPRGKSVTVVVPCYNYSEYLGDTIESVLRQSHKPSRIIVIDDGSTDDSVVVASKYKKQGVEIISKPNEGVVASKNLGIQLTITDWTIFLDADDMLEDDYIEKLLSVATKGNADIIFTDAQYFGASNKVLKARYFSFPALLRGNYIHNSALIGTDFLKFVGGYKEEMRLGYEDWELYITLAEAGAKFEYSQSTRLLYRQHGQVDSRNKEAQRKARELENKVRLLHRASYRKNLNPLIKFVHLSKVLHSHPLLLLAIAYGALISTARGSVVYCKYIKQGALGAASRYMNR